MSRLPGVFRDRNRPLLVTFVVGGDPTPEVSVRIAVALADAGADILELGMPFSDPTGDGPVIERADTRALRAGMTPVRLLSLVREVRRRTTVPIVLLCYYNNLFRYGLEGFCRDAAAAGVDGLLCVDLPVEQGGALRSACRKAGIDRILVAAPSTSDRRLARIGRESEGFVYAVSTMGVTGVRDHVPVTIGPLLERLHRVTGLPVAVGFGVGTPEQARAVAGLGADGVIVGSALVGLIETHLADERVMLDALGARVRAIRRALEGLPPGGSGNAKREEETVLTGTEVVRETVHLDETQSPVEGEGRFVAGRDGQPDARRTAIPESGDRLPEQGPAVPHPAPVLAYPQAEDPPDGGV